MTTWIILALVGAVGVLSTLLAIKTGKLKDSTSRVKKLEDQNLALTKEINSINETIKKLKEVRSQKAPSYIKTAHPGDSDSRISRLNGLSGT